MLLELKGKKVDLEEVGAPKVVQATTTAADNYTGWHDQLVKVKGEEGGQDIGMKLGTVCGIPVIASILRDSLKLVEAMQNELTCSVVFPNGEFDGDIVKSLKTMRSELSGNPRKGEQTSPMFANVRSCIQAAYLEALAQIGRALLLDAQNVATKIRNLAEGEALQKFLKDTGSPWPEASMPKLLEIASSSEASSCYQATKYLELHQSPMRLFVKNYGDKFDVDVAKNIAGFDYHPEAGRKIAGLLTSVQALGRALSAAETRGSLLSKCKAALQHKDMWKHMPSHVQQMISAGEAKKPAAPAS